MVYEQANSLYIYTSLCDEESKFRLLYPTIKCFYVRTKVFLTLGFLHLVLRLSMLSSFTRKGLLEILLKIE